jgi:hypothetical protein
MQRSNSFPVAETASWSATPALVPADELAARRSLRTQIAKLERELADTVAGAFQSTPLSATAPAGASLARPRLLDLGELERARDQLAERVRRARAELDRQADLQERSRIRLERMLLEPERHPFEIVRLCELGESGCGAYQVRPRLGLIGMLCGWWQVKLSSGCPLAGGRGLCAATRWIATRSHTASSAPARR